MAFHDYTEEGNRVLLMSNPRDIEDDWKMVSCWWWGRYVPESAKNDDLVATFIDVHCGELIQKFLARWKIRPQAGLISWTFPLHDATKLVIRAVGNENGRAKTYTLLDLALGTVGIAEDGSMFLGSTIGGPKPVTCAVLVTRDRVLPLVVEADANREALGSAAANVNSALQKLVATAGRAEKIGARA